MLGMLIGEFALDGIPWITGLSEHIGTQLNAMSGRFLHKLGTNASVSGAVGLFHVEDLTPEALIPGRITHGNLSEGLVITDQDLEEKRESFREATSQRDSPDLCLIGCPHLTLDELRQWSGQITRNLEGSGRERLAMKTILVAAPDVVSAFNDGTNIIRLHQQGVQVSSFCLEALIHSQHTAPRHAVTNSNKLRFYGANVSYHDDEELLDIMTTGQLG